jgi:hypothetical protein
MQIVDPFIRLRARYGKMLDGGGAALALAKSDRYEKPEPIH